jgi:hypothetical protein
VGDQILMLPGMGLRIRAIQPNRYFIAGDQEGGTWCLALYPTAGGCRLVSRWRVHWPLTPATAYWILISDPGAFLMKRRMLKGIRARAERSARSADASIGAKFGSPESGGIALKSACRPMSGRLGPAGRRIRVSGTCPETAEGVLVG